MPLLGFAVISWLGYIDTQFSDEVQLDNVKIGYKVLSQGIIFHCLSGCQCTSISMAVIVLHIWAVGPKGFLVETTTSFAFTLF